MLRKISGRLFPPSADPMFDLVKTRLTDNIRRQDSLYKQTLRFVVKNVVQKKNRSFHLSFLPQSVQQDCLVYLLSFKCENENGDEEKFQRIFEVFKLLLIGSKPKSINLNGLMTFCPSYQWLSGVMQAISTLAPDLECLTLSENRVHVSKFFHKPCTLDKGVIATILELKRLKKLIIPSYNVLFSDLETICINLKKLKTVDVMVYFGPYFDLDHPVDAFSRLEIFLDTAPSDIYLTDEPKPKPSPFRRLVDLPHLNLTWDWFSPCQPLHVCRIGAFEFYLEILLGSPEVGPSTKAIHSRFPDITHLKVVFCKNFTDADEIDAMLQFPKVESLTLEKIAIEAVLDRFLEEYGRNLHTLHVKKETSLAYDSQRIFDLCPNLENLYLDIDDNWSVEHLVSFAKLKHLQWDCSRRNRLGKFLHAPDLKTLVLCDEKLYEPDLSVASDLIREGRILRKLETLDITCLAAGNQINAVHRALSLFVKNAAVYLPNLTAINFRYANLDPQRSSAALQVLDLRKYLDLYRDKIRLEQSFGQWALSTLKAGCASFFPKSINSSLF